MNTPKPTSPSVTHEEDPVVAAFDNALDNALEEPLTDEERAALEQAIAHPGPGISSEELLERLRPKQ